MSLNVSKGFNEATIFFPEQLNLYEDDKIPKSRVAVK